MIVAVAYGLLLASSGQPENRAWTHLRQCMSAKSLEGCRAEADEYRASLYPVVRAYLTEEGITKPSQSAVTTLVNKSFEASVAEITQPRH